MMSTDSILTGADIYTKCVNKKLVTMRKIQDIVEKSGNGQHVKQRIISDINRQIEVEIKKRYNLMLACDLYDRLNCSVNK